MGLLWTGEPIENCTVTFPLNPIFYRECDREAAHTRAQYGGRWTDRPRRHDSHTLPNSVLRADANREDSPPSCPVSCPTHEQTDPRLDARLTQDHRRGTSGRERRVREQQEEQEATREQGCAVGTGAETHGVKR